MTVVLDHQGNATGIFTDGDLRRLIERVGDVRGVKIADAMTKNPRHISADAMAVDAAQIMDKYRLNQILVSDARQTGRCHPYARPDGG